jgi:hypothetical protein
MEERMSRKRATPEQRILIRKLVRAGQPVALIAEMLELQEQEVMAALRPAAPPEGK